MRRPLSLLPRTRLAYVRAVAVAVSLSLVTACTASGEAVDENEDNAESETTGFTSFSGLLVVTLLEGTHEDGGQVKEILLSIYDPEEGEQLAQLTAGEMGDDGASGHSSLEFSADFSHLAYIEDETPESDILVYRLEGQEDAAELLHRIEPPSGGITGGRGHERLAFQPDGQRLWYSIDDGAGGDGDEVRSIGLEEGEEPQDEGTMDPRSWPPDAEGQPVDIERGNGETEVEGGTVEVAFRTDGQAMDPREIEFTAADAATSGPHISYEVVRPLGEDGVFLAGGQLTSWGGPSHEYAWGPLMRLTLTDTGEVDAHEVVVSETEKDGVSGLQVSPTNDAAVIAVTDGGLARMSAGVTDFYYVDLTDPADPQQLDGVLPDVKSEDYRGQVVDIMGWLE